jgi:hypothetical protein
VCDDLLPYQEQDNEEEPEEEEPAPQEEPEYGTLSSLRRKYHNTKLVGSDGEEKVGYAGGKRFEVLEIQHDRVVCEPLSTTPATR